MSKKVSIYILHITHPNQPTRHYVGATKNGRFKTRLAEHRNGYGSIVTKAAIREGCIIEGAIIHSNAIAQEELEYQFIRPLARLCPFCDQTAIAHEASTVAEPPSSPASDHAERERAQVEGQPALRAGAPLRFAPSGDASTLRRALGLHDREA